MVTELVFKNTILSNSLVVQWLGPHIFTAEDLGSILVRELRFCKPSAHSHRTLSFLRCSDRARLTVLFWIMEVLRA